MNGENGQKGFSVAGSLFSDRPLVSIIFDRGDKHNCTSVLLSLHKPGFLKLKKVILMTPGLDCFDLVLRI